MSLIARIEEDLCLAHGDCEAEAPEAFRVDDVARVVGETTDDRLRAAARACPAGAIVLYDADTGEEVDVCGGRHIRHSGGPPNGSRNSERTSKPWRR